MAPPPPVLEQELASYVHAPWDPDVLGELDLGGPNSDPHGGPVRRPSPWGLAPNGSRRAPLDVRYAGPPDRTAARTSDVFQRRVIDQFRTPENIAFLDGAFRKLLPKGALLDFAIETLTDSLYSFGEAEGLVESDPLAQRSSHQWGANLWTEVRRLNLAYITYRMEFLQSNASLLLGTSGDGQWDDNEPYHYRMFVADSLRPPGLEHLNSPGPLFGILEDQVADRAAAGPGLVPGYPGPRGPPTARAAQNGWGYRQLGAATGASRGPATSGWKWQDYPRGVAGAGAAPVRGSARESFAAAPSISRADSRAAPSISRADSRAAPSISRADSRAAPTRETFSGRPEPMPGVAPNEWGWSEGNPNRTAEQAVSEYWGEGWTETSTLGATEQAKSACGLRQGCAPSQYGLSVGSLYGWGNDWQANGGTRFMRRPEIPFWQKGGERAYDYDIEGTLGTQIREADNHVRRWNTDRMRHPRGPEYIQQGPRTGHFV